jgi:hypothetical protein
MFGTSKALLALAGGLLLGGRASAAPEQGTTVTGCLAKSAAKDTFNIKGEDGKELKLTSTTVKLEPHVGHKVTVEGGAPAADAPLSVTKLTMVSPKCS